MASSVFTASSTFPAEFVVLATSTHSGNAATIAAHRYIKGFFDSTVEGRYINEPVNYFSWVSMTYAMPYYTLTALRDLTCLFPDGTKRKVKSGEVISSSSWRWDEVKAIVVY